LIRINGRPRAARQRTDVLANGRQCDWKRHVLVAVFDAGREALAIGLVRHEPSCFSHSRKPIRAAVTDLRWLALGLRQSAF
jgi:hypothetical protein